MYPLFIFVLCAGFVLYLLRIEGRAARGNSWALWIPTIWMFIIASRPLVQWFDEIGQQDNDAGSILDRMVLIGLAIAAIIVLLHRGFNWLSCVRRQKWLWVVVAYMLLSTLWSDIPEIAFRRWSRELIVPIVAMVIISEADPRVALESVFRRTAYVLLPFSILLIKYFPFYGARYGRYSGIQMWVGVTGQKNQLGRLCAISCLFLAFSVYRYWRGRERTRRFRSRALSDAGIALLALFLLVGSDSSTSLISLLFGASILFGLIVLRRFKHRVPLPALLTLVLVLMAFGVVTPLVGGSNVASLTRAAGRDVTLTGRTEVWASVMPARAERPLLGYGLGSFWTDARRKLYDIPTSHNGYLDILLELGELGLSFCVIWVVSCARQLHRALARADDWAMLGISFLLMGLLYNTAESALNSLTEHMTAIVVFTSLVLSHDMPSNPNRAKSKISVNRKWDDEHSAVNAPALISSATARSW